MSAEQAKKEVRAINEAAKRISRSRKTAREFLIANGFVTKGLKPTKNYSRK